MNKASYEKSQEPYTEYLVRMWKEGAFGSNKGGVTTEPINPAALLVGPGGQLASGAIGAASGALGIGGGVAGGAGGGISGSGAGLVGQAQTMITRRFMGTAIAATLGAFLAASAGIPQTLIGKEFNKWASENNIDVGNLRLNAQIALFTTPVIDPVTQEIKFLDNDAARLKKRMAEAGIPKDLINMQMEQHQQQRNANELFIKQFQTGAIGEQGKTIQEQALAGETPIETLARLQKEAISKQKETVKASEQKAQQQMQAAQQFQQQQAMQQQNIQGFRQETGLPANESEIKRQSFLGQPEAMQIKQEMNKPIQPEPIGPEVPGERTPFNVTDAELRPFVNSNLSADEIRRRILERRRGGG